MIVIIVCILIVLLVPPLMTLLVNISVYKSQIIKEFPYNFLLHKSMGFNIRKPDKEIDKLLKELLKSSIICIDKDKFYWVLYFKNNKQLYMWNENKYYCWISSGYIYDNKVEVYKWNNKRPCVKIMYNIKNKIDYFEKNGEVGVDKKLEAIFKKDIFK